MDFLHRVAIARGGVDHGEVELEVGGVQLHEKLEDHVEHLVRAGVFAVDLVDDDDGLRAVFQRLFQNKLRLRLRAVIGVHDEQHAVDHLHDALHFAAEIRVAGGVHDVHVVVVPFEGRVLRLDGDALLPFEVHGVHDADLAGLGFVRAKGASLLEQLVHERGLAVIDVSDDGDVADVFHVDVLVGVVLQKGAEYGGGRGGRQWERKRRLCGVHGAASSAA